MDGFEVDYGRLAEDVSDLFAVSDGINEAVGAGLAAQEMSERAFGLLCMGMVPPAQLVQHAAIAALKAEAAAFEAAAMNLRNTAIDYEATDMASMINHNTIMMKVRR